MRKLIYAIIGGVMNAALWGGVFSSFTTIPFSILFGSLFGAGFVAMALISLYMHLGKIIE